jgi:hypothetical protein
LKITSRIKDEQKNKTANVAPVSCEVNHNDTLSSNEPWRKIYN